MREQEESLGIDEGEGKYFHVVEGLPSDYGGYIYYKNGLLNGKPISEYFEGWVFYKVEEDREEKYKL